MEARLPSALGIAGPQETAAEAASHAAQRSNDFAEACMAAAAVQRKPQLFLWMQTHLRRFVPHELAVCGAARPGQVKLAMHVFHSVPLPPLALAALADPAGALLREAAAACGESNVPAAALSMRMPAGGADEARAALLAHGFETLLVHAVSSVRDAHGLDSLFAFGARSHVYGATEAAMLGLLLPQLHLMTLRVCAAEAVQPEPRRRMPPAGPASLTLREREILLHVRDGCRNAQIGEALGISALTVKNHLQKILRKLGANNRAQAVAEALSHDLLAQGASRNAQRTAG